MMLNEKSGIIIISDSDSDWESLPDIDESIWENKRETTNYDFIYISDESEDFDIDDIKSMTDNYTEKLVLNISRKNNKQNQESINFFKSNDLILPYLFQSPSSDVYNYGKDLKHQPLLTVKIIDSYLEEGEQLVDTTANIASLYLYSFQPDSRLIQDLFKLLIYIKADIGLEKKSSVYCFEISSLLNVIFHCYPENLTAIWRSVMGLIYSVEKQEIQLCNFSLAIEHFLSVFESEFIQSKSFNLNQLKQCQSYRVLANEESYFNIKQIINWLKYVFNFLIYQYTVFVQTLVYKLQTFLDISINMSSRNTTMAKRIAEDLVGVYLNIPYLKYRFLLITTIRSDLLRFKVMETILDEHCDKTGLNWNQMPMSLGFLADGFFQALPPTNCLLDDEDDDPMNLSKRSWVSPSRCEELVMLLYYVVISYISCLQGSFDKPLSPHLTTVIDEKRSIPTTEPYETSVGCPPWGSLHKQLDGLSEHISQLKKHLNRISPELYRQPKLYIMLMDHLTDLVADDIVLSVF